jgi:hypothetical protein
VSEHITVGEFDRFQRRLFQQLDSIEAKQDVTNGRVTKLESNQEQAGKLSAKLSAGVSLLVAALVNGVIAALGGAKP